MRCAALKVSQDINLNIFDITPLTCPAENKATGRMHEDKAAIRNSSIY